MRVAVSQGHRVTSLRSPDSFGRFGTSPRCRGERFTKSRLKKNQLVENIWLVILTPLKNISQLSVGMIIPNVYKGYPLLICYSLLLKMAIEIVSFSHKKKVISHSYVNIYQRVVENIRLVRVDQC